MYIILNYFYLKNALFLRSYTFARLWQRSFCPHYPVGSFLKSDIVWRATVTDNRTPISDTTRVLTFIPALFPYLRRPPRFSLPHFCVHKFISTLVAVTVFVRLSSFILLFVGVTIKLIYIESLNYLIPFVVQYLLFSLHHKSSRRKCPACNHSDSSCLQKGTPITD